MAPTPVPRRPSPLPFAALGLAVALAAPLARAQTPPQAPPGTPQGTPPLALAEMQRLSDGFVQVAEQVLPAVVNIRVEAHAPALAQGALPFPFPVVPRTPRGDDELLRGNGSGIIVRADGVIVTNNHVVEDAERITVRLRDGREFPGRVLGTDPSTDLAVLQVQATGLPTAPWGDSDRARVGEWVLALGAPFGLEATVTHGVLSATGRGNLGANAIEDYLQTDASINPGNSGGALVNLRGEVLGINTMILGRGSGIGFAVPSRIARMVTEQLLAHGRVSRSWIGVGVQDLTADLAATLGVPPGSGALVSEVEPGAPGARAGLAPGDVITLVDGRRVTHSNDVVAAVTAHGPGQRLALSLLRGSVARQVTLDTAARPGDSRRAPRRTAPTPPRPAAQTLGLEVSSLTPARLRQVGAPQAVQVTRVEPESAAERAGLRPGDVILQADQQPVRASGDLQAATQDGRAALLIRRGGRQLFVPLVLQP
ncbi:MAG: trypsin-like peptidase domain-containing protein [Deltaproteobacteria bacterium]|nr:trypsin-like peptidase domain-containing protein [Deltaproteobacteria bacterium]